MMKQHVKISVMALVAMLAFSTTASAQFGSLKGLAKKAKQAVQDKARETVSDAKSNATTTVQQQAETTVGETTGVSTGSDDGGSTSASGGSSSVKISEEELPQAKQSAWTIEGDQKAIAQQSEYLASLMQQSMKRGYQGLDYKSYCDLLLAAEPLLPVMQVRIDQGGYTWDMKQAESRVKNVVWNFKQVAWAGMPGQDKFDLTAALQKTKFIADRGLSMQSGEARAAFFDMAYTQVVPQIDKVTGSEAEWSGALASLQQLLAVVPDEYKTKFPKTLSLDIIKANQTVTANMKKHVGMLILYKEAASKGNYGTAPVSKNPSYEKVVREDVELRKPYWGKVLAVSVGNVSSTRKNKLGVVTHRHRPVSVMTEDQGYKVLHYEMVISEESLGSGKWGAPRVTGASYEQDQPIKLVK
ncbi:MAG: hypothetical protein IJ868_04675 [Prevotella sp.]|nr:hypothetical protein [Prevotella sp.]